MVEVVEHLPSKCEALSSNPGWVPVAQACNPTYSGGRDQEDQDSKPALENSLRDPILKKPITKKGWWCASSCMP
jgi:hypothetical protein